LTKICRFKNCLKYNNKEQNSTALQLKYLEEKNRIFRIAFAYVTRAVLARLEVLILGLLFNPFFRIIVRILPRYVTLQSRILYSWSPLWEPHIQHWTNSLQSPKNKSEINDWFEKNNIEIDPIQTRLELLWNFQALKTLSRTVLNIHQVTELPLYHCQDTKNFILAEIERLHELCYWERGSGGNNVRDMQRRWFGWRTWQGQYYWVHSNEPKGQWYWQ
jgi:hypothetical protein